MNGTVLGSSGVSDGRERAMRTLFDEQRGGLYSYVLRLLGGDQHKAEDIVQETMLRCWRKHSLDGTTGLRPWMFRVARNIVIDEYRLRQARPSEVNGNVWLEGCSAEHDDIEQSINSVVLGEAFRRLSPMHREVLYEMYFIGRTVQEVSRVLGIPSGTVKSRLHYALKQMKLMLQEREESAAADTDTHTHTHTGTGAGTGKGSVVSAADRTDTHLPADAGTRLPQGAGTHLPVDAATHLPQGADTHLPADAATVVRRPVSGRPGFRASAPRQSEAAAKGSSRSSRGQSRTAALGVLRPTPQGGGVVSKPARNGATRPGEQAAA